MVYIILYDIIISLVISYLKFKHFITKIFCACRLLTELGQPPAKGQYLSNTLLILLLLLTG